MARRDKDKIFLFTDKKIQNLKPDGKARKERFYDSNLSTLCLYLTYTGTKTFYHVKNDNHTRIGRFPDISVAEARKLSFSGVKKQTPLVRDFLYEYIKQKTLYVKNWKTIQDVLYAFLLPNHGQKTLDQITPDDIFHLFTHITQEHGKSSANRFLSTVSGFFNKAVDRWHIDRNPAKGIRKHTELPRNNTLEALELPDFLRALRKCKKRIRCIISILLLTAVRKTNALQAKWEDIDFDNRVWKIPETKNGYSQVIPLTPSAISVFKEMEVGRVCDKYVFATAKGKISTSIQPQWKTLLKRAGIKNLRIHDLRRTSATLLLKYGTPLNIVSKILGHRNIGITHKVYAQVGREALEEGLFKLDTLLDDFSENNA